MLIYIPTRREFLRYSGIGAGAAGFFAGTRNAKGQGIPFNANGMAHAQGGGSNVAITTTSGNANDASSTSLISASANATGANTIVIACQSSSNNTVTTTITDSSSNTWTQFTGGESENVGTLRMYYAKGATVSGTHTVTCTFGSASTFRRIMVWYLSGASATAPDDGITQHNEITAGDPITATTASLTPSAAGGIIIFAGSNNDGSTCVFSANNGFSLSFGTSGTLNGVATKDTDGMTLLNSTGAQTPSMGMTAGGGRVRVIAVGIKK
jgi:hypothetical protein